jgi:coenzyme F420-0:L-glutamate ligase/coenzyme F420-1:gamma-L-glutamate ligase
MAMSDGLSITPLLGIPMVEPGDDIAALIARGLSESSIRLIGFDVLVIAQKIVSKAENRYVQLRDVNPSPRAYELAEKTGKDPRLVEVILSESQSVVRFRKGVLITVHHLGFVAANAGVDQSNIAQDDLDDRVLLLPQHPDRSAEKIRSALENRWGIRLGIIINDSFGRPWRNGVVSVALGAAGLPAVRSLIGKPDLFGRKMRVTECGFADQIATAASLVMGETNEGWPVIHLRGLRWSESDQSARELIRPLREDLFR